MLRSGYALPTQATLHRQNARNNRSECVSFISLIARKLYQFQIAVDTRHGARGKDCGWAAAAQSIDQRPQAANERTEIGHVECDLMTGRQRDRFRLLVTIDRKTRLIRLAKPRFLATQTAQALRTLLKETGLKTLTSDRGAEFARLPHFFKDKFYACHAYRGDERGSCEHVIDWIREFFPKGHTLDQATDEYVKEVEDIINRRPRKIFGGLAPIELHFPSPRARTVRT